MSEYSRISEPKLGEQYVTWTHKSGLTVFVIPKKHASTYALLATRYGSVDVCFKTEKDADYLTLPDGVAHFLEHKMFEDEQGNDAFARYAQTGASANAFTSNDRTAYLFSCTEQFEKNLEILLDFVSHPFFSKQTIAKEQGIIGEEISMYNDNPSWCVYLNMLSAMYHKNPVRNSVAGTRESIAQITPEMLYRCTDTFYNLHNMGLFVCGDVTPEQVDAVCDKVLPESSPLHTVERVYPEEPEEVRLPLIEQTFAVSQPTVLFGFKDVPTEDPMWRMRITAANAITCQLLFGRSGDFYNRLYESGLINDKFGGGYAQERNAAFTEVNAVCDRPQELKRELLAEISKRHAVYYTQEEFDTAKRVVYANNLFAFDSTEDVASTFMSFWVSEGDCFAYSKLLSEMTLQEAWEIFRKTIRVDRFCMSVLYPENTEVNT